MNIMARLGNMKVEKEELPSLANISRVIYEKPLRWKIVLVSLSALLLSTNVVSGFFQQDNKGYMAFLKPLEMAALPTTESSADGFLIKPSIQTVDGERIGVSDLIKYTVRPGDIVSRIAARFNISSDTILAANGLNWNSVLKPGVDLIILPVDGLLHKVQQNDTLDKIAKKYNIDKNLIIAQNDLIDTNLTTGTQLIIPGAKRVIITPPPQSTTARYASIFSDTVRGTSITNIETIANNALSRFAYNCVKAERVKNPDLPYGLFSLKQKEAKIEGSAPVPGATVVTTEGGYSGHVAHVEKVENGRIFISECNYKHGKCTTRWLDTTDPVIKGYIY